MGTDEQSQQVRRSPSVIRLLETRDGLRRLILREFGELRMAVGEATHAEYQELERMINSSSTTKRLLWRRFNDRSGGPWTRGVSSLQSQTLHRSRFLNDGGSRKRP